MLLNDFDVNAKRFTHNETNEWNEGRDEGVQRRVDGPEGP